MNIVINRSDAIGDLALTLPMVSALKWKYQQVRVSLIISPRTRELVDLAPDIFKYLVLDPQLPWQSRWRLVADFFRALRPERYYHVGGQELPNWVAWYQGIPWRGGMKSRSSTFFTLNRGIRQRRSQAQQHEVWANLDLLGPEFKEFNPHHHRMSLALGSEDFGLALSRLQEECQQQLVDFFPQDRFIVLHPGMSGHTLNWPGASYAQLIAQIEVRFPQRFLFVISHTPSDQPYLKTMQEEFSRGDYRHLRKRVVYFNGATWGLRCYLALLAQAQLMIGPSTGPLHLANWLGVSLVGIYSPIRAQSARRWKPFFGPTAANQILVPEVICGEPLTCALKACLYYPCMGKLPVAVALAAVEGIINND